MIRSLVFTASLGLAALAPQVSPAAAQAADGDVVLSRAITVAQDKSLAFRLNGLVSELVVAQPDIAEIVAKTDRSFYIRGKSPGVTNILVYGPDQQLLEVIDVRVGPDADALRADLASSLPGEMIRVSHLADGFLLSGEVSSSAVAARAEAVAQRYAPEAISANLQVLNPEQVILEVRILEASRTELQEHGINLSLLSSDVAATFGVGLLGVSQPAGTVTVSGVTGTTSIDATLRALEEKGLIRTLAQPNLVALSGEEASFLAGGEFPYPVPTGLDQVTIEFRPYGVTLRFTPFVRENGLIRLKVEPEVSQLDVRQSLQLNGFELPSLTVRRASTTVELQEGRSFAIAGLFQQDETNSQSQTPLLGDLPILGALFRSERWREQETELIIVVTPRLAAPGVGIQSPLWDATDETAPPAAPPVGDPVQATAPLIEPVRTVAPEAEPATVPVTRPVTPPAPSSLEIRTAEAAPPAPALAAPATIDGLLERISQQRADERPTELSMDTGV